MIHEQFTLLPCPKSAQTTLDLEGCGEHAILKSDAKINALAKLIVPQLYDNTARVRFVSGERAWLTYRRVFCQSQSDLYEGGTDAAVVEATCVSDVNDAHVKALTLFHRDLSRH